MIFTAGYFFGIYADSCAALLLDVKKDLQVDAVRVIDITLGVAHRDDFAAALCALFSCILCYVAGAGNNNRLAFKAVILQMLQRFGSIVAKAVTGGLGSGERTAEGKPFACQHSAVKAVGNALVSTEEEADFTCTDTDVACGHVGKLANMPVKLCHKALAEAHHFGVGLALRVKVGTAFAAAHGQGGQGVFKNLFEPKELQDGQIDGRMEAQAAFVRADGRVELDTETAVYLYLAAVIHPGDAELNHALRLHKTLEQACLFPLGMLVNHKLERFKNFSYCLKKFRFVAVSGFYCGVNSLKIFILHGK